MESHTLEILQQGIWASLTGGWFYDLRQDVFCNTFHLYLWLFLLCFPFILHLYFVPSIVIYSFYCGTIGFLFTILKLLNHRLHKIFDTKQCIQEFIPGEDLPESQRKRSQTLNAKNVLEGDGIELQVLGDRKAINKTICNGSVNEPTDDDSIISLEVAAGAREVSSTIDLKVDIHRKNSSESSEELSANPVGENDVNAKNEAESVASIKQSCANETNSGARNLRFKHNKLKNNILRFKAEERNSGFNEDDFVLSQSDCYIAKQRKKSLEELSKEYKMSQSDCLISNLRQISSEKLNVNNSADLSSSFQSHFSAKEACKKKCCKPLCKHPNSDFQPDQNHPAIEKNKSFDMGNLISNGSCGILTLNQSACKNVAINTGSLELPLRDIENASCIEKGLLYWNKQQNLAGTGEQNFQESQILSGDVGQMINSEFVIPSSLDVQNAGKCLQEKASDSNGDESLDRSAGNNDEILFCGHQSREKSFLKVLEENFDWCGCEYEREKPEERSTRIKFNPKETRVRYKSDEEVKGQRSESEGRTRCGLKFQIDSDEDFSDNRGSQSPLLCRHDSLKKANSSSANYLFGESSVKKIPRSFSGEEEQNQARSFSKMNRTLSVDECVASSDQFKRNVEPNAFSSLLATVHDGEGGEVDSRDAIEIGRSSEEIAGTRDQFKFSRNSGKKSVKGAKGDPVPLALTEEADEEPDIRGDRRQEEEKKKKKKKKKKEGEDFQEKVGLDWLFECTDSEEENPQVRKKCSCSCELHETENSGDPNLKSHPNRGAIPKTKPSKLGEAIRSKNLPENHFEEVKGKNSMGSGGGTAKRVKIERENKIIDEEDGEDVAQDEDCASSNVKEKVHRRGRKDPSWRETCNSSSSSATELSSLLPLSSLLSSLHPPSSPLLAAFLATRKDISKDAVMPSTGHCGSLRRSADLKETDRPHQNVTFVRNRHKRNKRTSRGQRTSRSSRVSSLPLVALASVVSTNSGTHLATSYDDTSQGAVHCFQDERGNWMSYTFESPNGSLSSHPVPLGRTNCENTACGEENLNSESGLNCGDGKCLQAVTRSTYIQLAIKGERDLSFINLVNPIRGGQSESSEQCRRKGIQTDQCLEKGKKSIETLDVGSNSNSEHDSSLSWNSGVATPGIDATSMTVRPTFASFVRERFIANQRTMANTVYLGPTANSAFLNLIEFPNNGTNDTNNNNNNSTSSSNGGSGTNSDRNNNSNFNSNFSLRSNFYAEEATDSVSVRSPFDLIAETFLDRSRQRGATFHLGPAAIVQNPQLPVTLVQQGNEQESDRNHFRLFDFDDLDANAEVKSNRPRHYYKLHYTPWNFVKVRFDRLELMALLDRNLTHLEIFISLFLSVSVSVCGILLLNCGFYRDLFAFLFCFALAGCQYSLLKSVQPDATSPTHGYNRVVIYSRSIYFCAASLLILSLTAYLNRKSNFSFQFYSIQFDNNNSVGLLRDGLVNLLLLFPVLFTLGLFPQINTFCLYLLEQVDMHVFGGNAMSSLVGAFYCIFRSIFTVIFVYGFAYGALSEAKTSQHILFSIFSALLISLSYHLSRSSSNPNVIWDIFKDHLIQDELLEEKNRANGRENESVNKKTVEESLRGSDPIGEKSEDRNGRDDSLLSGDPSSNERSSRVDADSQAKKLDPKSRPSGNSGRRSSGSGSTNDADSEKREKTNEEFVDPLPEKLKRTVNARLKNDAIVCSFAAVLVFGIHCSTVFTALQPDLNPILWGIAGCSGFVLHYVVPELRKHLPWLCLAGPVLKCHEHAQFEVKNAAKVMWFEETYVILCFLERNVLYPVLVLAALTYDGPRICTKFGVPLGALITSVCGLKIMRSAFSNTCQQYLVVIFSALLFEFDYHSCSETFLVDYFFTGIVFSKAYEFLLKIRFVVIYIAPWQITWGSAFHAFAQPFSVPHSAMLFIQAAISAVLSAPLNPFLGSAIFLASYVRPIKFWERDYNTKRVDHSNTRMSSHLERNLGSDDNNLNSIFYEHLTRSLQHTLCGDLELGRWGPVYQGDCFVLASDYLNCLVHIIEIGNGLVTFQMRGLEFRGTYCQQREVEAISERVEDDDGCCCCEPCHVPHMLSVNAAFSKRWLAWEVTASKYVLEGYSISDNSAASTLQVFDFRKVLVTYYVKSIIFYCIRSPKLQNWLTNPTILTALEPLADRSFVDLDPVFNINIDQDFDIRAEGITRNSFCNVYLEWIHHCCSKLAKPVDKSLDVSLISLCLALSLIGRRTLGTASHNTVSSVEFFLYGLHALFKGDFRITSIRDDWIFADMEFLTKVVAPGVRMSLKLHQDHFMSPEEYEDPNALFEAISSHEENLVISHEGDPAWRSAVLSGIPSLLALRHVLDDGTDEYKIIMLNKRFLSFRVIKLNRECVRGLWAGQQQELVFLRNRNPERGSIQNAKQVLRNMINSSCDQPIGYPIYVSPLTTSYSDTNKQLTGILGGPLSLQALKNFALKTWKRIGQRFREGCSSGSVANADEGGGGGGSSFGHEGLYSMTNVNVHSGYGHATSGSQSVDSSQVQLGSSNRGGSLGRSSLGGRGSIPSVGKPSSTTLASLAGLLSSAELSKGECFLRDRETSFTFIKERQSREEKESGKKLDERREEKERRREEKDGRKEKEKLAADHCDENREKEPIYQRVRIIHPNLVFDAINLGRRIDVLWPDEGMRLKGGRSYWKDWLPDSGMEGQVVHRWVPNHRDPAKRSNVDKTILLVKVDEKYVPIAEAGVQDLGVEV